MGPEPESEIFLFLMFGGLDNKMSRKSMILSGKICTFQIITGTKNKDELHLHENKTKSEDLVRAPEAGA